MVGPIKGKDDVKAENRYTRYCESSKKPGR